MNYEVEVLTPIDLYVNEPLITEIPLELGVISRTQIYLPFGSAGLLHISIWYQETQLLPINRLGKYRGNNVTFTSDSLIDLTQEPHSLKIHTYNYDEVYPHSAFFNFEINKPSENVEVQRFLASFSKVGDF